MNSGNWDKGISPHESAACPDGGKEVQVVEGDKEDGKESQVDEEEPLEDYIRGLNEQDAHRVVKGSDDDDEIAMPEVPVEDHGASRIRAMKAPAPPSRQEVLEHNILHCPFRAWCPECVAGKCKSKPHVSKKGEEEQSVPLVAFDYAFLGDASVKASPVAEEKAEIKVLVGRDKRSRVYCSIVVPQKGVDQD